MSHALSSFCTEQHACLSDMGHAATLQYSRQQCLVTATGHLDFTDRSAHLSRTHSSTWLMALGRSWQQCAGCLGQSNRCHLQVRHRCLPLCTFVWWLQGMQECRQAQEETTPQERLYYRHTWPLSQVAYCSDLAATGQAGPIDVYKAQIVRLVLWAREGSSSAVQI